VKHDPIHGCYAISRTSVSLYGKIASYAEPDLEDGVEILEVTIVSDDELELGGGLVKREYEDSEPECSSKKKSGKMSRR
jgi:hypothetical protein